jgi:hypothetical protein
VGALADDRIRKKQGRRMSKRIAHKRKIGRGWVPHLGEMLRSPAFKVLSRAARQVLARIEIELVDHGGKDNGRLPVTFDQFVAYGINRHMIAPALRELVALGFVEITEHGRAGNADWRRPNMFRLTYLPVDTANPTHEWRAVTEDDAEMIAKNAKKNSKSIVHKNAKTSAVSSTKNCPSLVSKSAPKAPNALVSKSALLSRNLPSLGEGCAAPAPAETKPKLPWSTPTLTEVPAPDEIARIRQLFPEPAYAAHDGSDQCGAPQCGFHGPHAGTQLAIFRFRAG